MFLFLLRLLDFVGWTEQPNDILINLSLRRDRIVSHGTYMKKLYNQ